MALGADVGIGQMVGLARAAAGADIAYVCCTIEPLGRVVNETVEKLGLLGILVNNASIICRPDPPAITEVDEGAVVDIDLKLMFLCQTARCHVIGQGEDKIINKAILDHVPAGRWREASDLGEAAVWPMMFKAIFRR